MRKLLPQAHQTAPRGGTTLTEVLMSLLCMGIGVVAVAALFPIALLRSVQATQLTSATILRFNAETLIDLHDEIPIGDPALARNLILNPNYDPRPDPDEDFDFGEHFSSAYLVDPLGAMIVRPDRGLDPTQTDRVGDVNGNGGMERFDALRIFYDNPNFDEREAEDVVTLPDSWVTLFDKFPSATPDRNSVQVNDLTAAEFTEIENLINSGIPVRVVLFSINGNLSETRTINSLDPANNTIRWNRPLPANNQYDPVSRIRIEHKERRYTWLLTVRNDTPTGASVDADLQAHVDVVVFFRRAPSRDDERPYQLNSLGGRRYSVTKLDPNHPDPFVKKGGFMLNVDEGTWHRIQLVEGSSASPRITLERNTSTNFDGDNAVFMRGVVDVYPLGLKP